MTTISNIIKQCECWLKCCISVNEYITNALLDVVHNDGHNRDFYTGLPRDPQELYLLLANSPIIDTLHKTKQITSEQYEILVPPKRHETDSRTFDPTLIMILIRNLTSLVTDNGRWKEEDLLPTDQSLAAYAVKAIAFRNFIYHKASVKAMSKLDLDNHLTTVQNILIGMKSTVNIKEIKLMSLDPLHIPTLKALYRFLQVQVDKLQEFQNKNETDIGKISTFTNNIAQITTELNQINLNREEIKQTLEGFLTRAMNMEDRLNEQDNKIKGIHSSCNLLSVFCLYLHKVNSYIWNIFTFLHFYIISLYKCKFV